MYSTKLLEHHSVPQWPRSYFKQDLQLHRSWHTLHGNQRESTIQQLHILYCTFCFPTAQIVINCAIKNALPSPVQCMHHKHGGSTLAWRIKIKSTLWLIEWRGEAPSATDANVTDLAIKVDESLFRAICANLVHVLISLLPCPRQHRYFDFVCVCVLVCVWIWVDVCFNVCLYVCLYVLVCACTCGLSVDSAAGAV